MATRLAILSNEYNPYEHRERPGQTGSINALINLIKALTGTGILAMPEAFKRTGFLIGTIFTFVITFVILYCLQLMFSEMYFICKRDKIPFVNYPKLMKEALLVGPNCFKRFSNCSPYAVNFFIILYQFGVCCIYLVFCAKNIKMIVDDNTKEDTHFSLTMYMTFFIIPFLMLTFIKDLRMLAPFSNIGNWLTLLCIVIIYYCIFVNLPPISDRKICGDLVDFPLFMGMVMYSVLSIGAILSIELNMKNGADYVSNFGVLNVGMFIVVIFNAVTGFLGYWKYGEQVLASITLNLGRNGFAWSVQAIFAMIIVFSFPLQAYPATEILWDQYIEEHMSTSKHKMFWDYAVRAIMVLGTYIISVPLPFLGHIISFVGAFCLSILGIILPPFIDICLRWDDGDFGTAKIILLRDIFIILFGFAGFISGTYFPIMGIVHGYQESLSAENA